MADIYEQHRAAFLHVSAFVVMHGVDRVATIAFKFPRDGASRLYAYVHWLGEPMVRGSCGGFGYDKKSAACASAARALPTKVTDDADRFESFRSELKKNDGMGWERNLREAGFTLYQAV